MHEMSAVFPFYTCLPYLFSYKPPSNRDCMKREIINTGHVFNRGLLAVHVSLKLKIVKFLIKKSKMAAASKFGMDVTN